MTRRWVDVARAKPPPGPATRHTPSAPAALAWMWARPCWERLCLTPKPWPKCCKRLRVIRLASS
eukprot:5271837-Prorocentrum_lima.AAC.1